MVLLLTALITFPAPGDVKFTVQCHDDGEFLGHHDVGNVILAQIIPRVVRQHHIDAAQRVMHGRPALAGFEPMPHECALQREHAVIDQAGCFLGIRGEHKEWLHQGGLFGRHCPQRLTLMLELTQRAFVIAAPHHVRDPADQRPNQNDQHQP
ncbi:hypothetical protein D3C87_1695210 [compost metagenome]